MTLEEPKSYRQTVMFPGDSCYQLSPLAEDKAVSIKDQLFQILRGIGPQDARTIENIEGQNERNFVKKMQGQLGQRKPGLETKLNHCPSDIYELIKSMLKFDPEDRLSAR